MSSVSAIVTVLEAEKLGHTLVMPWCLARTAREVAKQHNVTVEALLGSRGSSVVTEARHELMWLLRLRGVSSPRIGQFMGRHHSTVLHGAQRHEWRLAARRVAA